MSQNHAEHILNIQISTVTGLPKWQNGKESACQCERDRRCRFDWEVPLEKEMATHSSILAWEIPWDRRAWWTTAHGVAKNQVCVSDWAHMHSYKFTTPSDSPLEVSDEA